MRGDLLTVLRAIPLPLDKVLDYFLQLFDIFFTKF